MKIIKYTLTIFLILLGFCLKAQEFHVAKNGDDDNSGSQNSPWESIQHAMDYATVGSTVHIHEGIYYEALYVNVSGEENNYITFIAFENDEVIIDATGQTSTAIIEVYGVHHIAIENLILRNHQRNDAIGILVEGACDHIRIDDCEIYNVNFSEDPDAAINEDTNAHGIAVYADDSDHAITDLQINDNEIHDCRLGYSEALVVNGNVDGFEIIDNEVYDVTNIGIDIIGHEGTCDDPAKDQARNGYIAENVTYNCLSPYATSAGIYVDGGKNLIIERNRVYNNQWGIEIGCENIGKTTDNVIVRNNLIYGNSTSGLAIGGYDYPTGSGKVTNVSFINNTLFGNDTENDYSGEIYLFYTENFEMINNIIYGTSTTNYLLASEDLIPSLGLRIENNNWTITAGVGQEEFYFNGIDYEGITEFEAAVSGVANTSLQPGFVSSSSNYDFRLIANSGLIDIGKSTNKSGNEDFSGNERVIGGSIDIGAFEYNPSLSLEEKFVSNIEIYPNPTFDFIRSSGGEISRIYSIDGRLCFDGVADKTKEVNVSNWKPGLYFVHLSDGSAKHIILK